MEQDPMSPGRPTTDPLPDEERMAVQSDAEALGAGFEDDAIEPDYEITAPSTEAGPVEEVSFSDFIPEITGETAEGDEALAREMSAVESLLLVSSTPLSLDRIAILLGKIPKVRVRRIADELRKKYDPATSGILVEEVAKGLQFRTNPANIELLRELLEVKPKRFTQASLEVLSIVAYKQPMTRAEVEKIRGVDCAGALKTLLDRKLVKIVGRKDVPGRPILFGTSREFLELFGLAGLADLPSLREIEDLIREQSGGVVVDESDADALSVDLLAPPRDPESELSSALHEAEGEEMVASDASYDFDSVPDDVLSEAAGLEGETTEDERESEQ